MVCWDLDQRGDVGETALHLSLLFSKQPKYRDVAIALLDAFPQLCLDYYEGDEYYGKLQLFFKSTFNHLKHTGVRLLHFEVFCA